SLYPAETRSYNGGPCARCAAARMIAGGGAAAGGFLLRLSYRRMEPKPRRVTRLGRGADGASIPRPRISPFGLVAEWSCSGLQSRLRRFDSDPSLQNPVRRRPAVSHLVP